MRNLDFSSLRNFDVCEGRRFPFAALLSSRSFLAMYWIQPLPGNVSSTQGSYKPLHVDFLAKYWLGLVLHSTLTR